MNPIPVLPQNTPIPVIPLGLENEQELRAAAVKLEATFLSEMLKAAGFQSGGSGFGGGIGEDQFTSFLRDAQAQKMAEAGGIGLAEALFNAMRTVQSV